MPRRGGAYVTQTALSCQALCRCQICIGHNEPDLIFTLIVSGLAAFSAFPQVEFGPIASCHLHK